jgi:hypothetical protein
VKETVIVEKPKVTLRCYSGKGTIITVYFPDGDKAKVYYIDQKWIEPILDYCIEHGVKTYEIKWVYSRLVRDWVYYRNPVWKAEIEADKLLKLILSTPTWHRSVHATEIVEKLKEITGRRD